MKWIVKLICLFFVLGCCDDDDIVEDVINTRVAVLIVDEETKDFEGGKINNYDEVFDSYALEVENLAPNDAGYIKIYLKPFNNQLIYFASQIFMGSGEIFIPNPITPPHQFEYVITNDYRNIPDNAIELTNIGSVNVEYYWASIQGLRIVREALLSPNSQVHYFRQDLNAGIDSNAKWIFIVKY